MPSSFRFDLSPEDRNRVLGLRKHGVHGRHLAPNTRVSQFANDNVSVTLREDFPISNTDDGTTVVVPAGTELVFFRKGYNKPSEADQRLNIPAWLLTLCTFFDYANGVQVTVSLGGECAVYPFPSNAYTGSGRRQELVGSRL